LKELSWRRKKPNQTQKTLEIYLDEVMHEILPKRAVIKQKDYMWKTKKPKGLRAKQWLRRLEYINNNLRWLSSKDLKMNQGTFNRECIVENLPETWKLEFIKDPVYQRIMDASKDDQPWMREIISATKTLQTIKETRVAFQERHARPQGRSQEKN